jgi:hypothetical protein
MFMVPASVWLDPKPPFASRDYEGLKSQPEYGLTVSIEALTALERYRFKGAAFARSLAADQAVS